MSVDISMIDEFLLFLDIVFQIFDGLHGIVQLLDGHFVPSNFIGELLPRAFLHDKEAVPQFLKKDREYYLLVVVFA